MHRFMSRIDEGLGSFLNLDKFLQMVGGALRGSKSRDELKVRLTEILGEFRGELQRRRSPVRRDVLDARIVDLTKELGEDAVRELNLDAFVRGIYNVLLVKGDRRERINRHFDEYISHLDTHLDRLEQGPKDFSGDEEFEELLKLKSERFIKIPKKAFNIAKVPLQVELLKMQEHLKVTGGKVAIVFEGRDAAGKGSAIRTITEFLDPKWYRVATFGIPTEEEKKNWFGRYVRMLPPKGKITFFDRSWYNRAVNDPVMGYCTEEEYRMFMTQVVPFEKWIAANGVQLIKLWFSVDRETQKLRFQIRQASPLKYWKFSPSDEKSAAKWDVSTQFKEQMFEATSTVECPWVVVDSNEKRVAKLNVMKYVLDVIPYENKDESLLDYDPEIVYPLV